MISGDNNIYRFAAHRRIEGWSHYEDEDESDIFNIANSDSFLKCIKKINMQRNKDIETHKNGKYINDNCVSIEFTIRYSINGFDIYEDEYEDHEIYDDESILSKSSAHKYHDIDKQHKNNIKKCISNCLQKDKEKINWKGKGKLDHIGNINCVHINKLLEEQQYNCYLCGDNVITYMFVSYCCYKFSIDRIDNNKPHDKDNVKISCYFCNCKDHTLYDKKVKIKCDKNECFCNDKLYTHMIAI